jgi:subtilisin-like proprotein convertase family protein
MIRLSAFLARRTRPLAHAALAALLLVAPQLAPAAMVNWQGWAFDHAVSSYYDGLSLKNVTYQGRPIIRKLSLPVMRVFYENDDCGPYADRLGGSLSVIPWAGNAKLAKREFTLNGQLWYEIGIRDQIGSYDIYQVYYLSADGTIDAHIYSKGLQCVTNHIHYPNWRIDFDLDGAASDQIQRDAGIGFETMAQEFNAPATAAANHAWRVRDASTGLTVDVLPGFPDFSIPASTTVPVTEYSHNTVFGRLYRSTEDRGWTFGPNVQVPYNNGEDIGNADVVLWYEGYLPHAAADGSELWHSTGLRLVTNMAGTPPPPPPPPPPPGSTGTRSFSGGPVTVLDDQAASPYPSTVDVTDMGGAITKVTVRLDGVAHTYPDDLDVALVGPGGQTVMLMSDAGGSIDISDVSLTFDAAASATLSSTSKIVSGTYRPANYAPSDTFPAPAPGGTYGTSLSVFNGLGPAGTWRLFVRDDSTTDIGAIATGWVLTITTQ